MFKKRKLSDFLPFLVIAVLVAAFFGKTLLPPQGFILHGGDLNDQFYFWKGFWAANIKHGIIPFWNPYSFSGTPFLAHPSIAAFYPFNIIFLIFTINIAFSIYLYTHIVLAGVFMYILCRKFTDKTSALTGGIVFSLSGLMAARIYSGHIDIISTVIWIPAVFWSTINALETKKRRDILVSILFLTLQILAGYQAVVIFTLELIFIYHVVITAIRHCEEQSDEAIYINKDRHASLAMTDGIKPFLTLLFIIVISFGISAIQLLPTIEFVHHSIRGQGLPYNLLTWGSYTKDQFLMFINPFRYGNPFPENYTYKGPGPNFFEISYFVGIIPLLIFLIFMIYQLILILQKKKINKVFTGLLIGILFFSLAAMGNNFPLHKLLYQLIPTYRLFRFPSQHLIMVVFILAFISSFAISKLKNKWLRFIIIFLITLELLSYDKKFIRLSSIPTQKLDTDLVNILREDSGLFRVLPDYSVVSSVRNSWDFESSMYYGIQSTSGYNPILLSNYYQFIDLLNNNHSSSISQYNVEIPPPDLKSNYIDFLNVKYVLTDKNYDLIQDKSLNKFILKKVGETFRLYENKDYLPRFLLNCPDKEKNKIEIVDYQINNIKLRTNSSCNGLLSSSEVYYPGWKAMIDDRETQVYKSNTAFRSIFLPKGDHEIELYYQPTIYYIGGLISLFSIIMLTVWLKRSPKTESKI